MIIFGGGVMGESIANGLISNGYEGLSIVEPNEERRQVLKDIFEDEITILESADRCEEAIIATKPKDVRLAIEAAVDAGAKRVLSIAAGVTLAQLHEAAGPHIGVVRAMPNVGAMVSTSASAVCVHETAKPDDLTWATGIMDHIGITMVVNESQMDAVTGLSGSGPAYVALMVESMIDAGVCEGLDYETAEALVFTCLLSVGSLHVMGSNAAEIRRLVTTPGGTTAAGLAALEKAGIRSAFASAVSAATNRSREMNK